MSSINHKKRAIATFVTYHVFCFLVYWILMARTIYYAISYQKSAPLPFAEWIMIILIFVIVFVSALVMRFVFIEATKANLKWLRIVSRIQEITYWAMIPVGGIGLFIGAIVA